MTVVIERPVVPTKVEDEVYEQTLAFVNELRASQGREPLDEMPQGVPDSAADCPVARALPFGRTSVGPPGMSIRFGDARFDMPPYVSQFIREFDSGLRPELRL